jgi:hypothetical protein
VISLATAHTFAIPPSQLLTTIVFSKKDKKMEGARRKLQYEDAMKRARSAVRSKKIEFQKAAETYEVPRKALFRLLQKNVESKELLKPKLGKAKHEEQLVTYAYLLLMETNFSVVQA